MAAVSFIVGWHRITQRKPPTCRKFQVTFYPIMLYRVYHTISGIRTHEEYLSFNHNYGNLLVYRTPTSTSITWKATCSRNDIAAKMLTWLLTKITHYLRRECCTCELMMTWFIFGVLTPVSTIFQLYHGVQFLWWRKSEYPERTTDHGQATGHLFL